MTSRGKWFMGVTKQVNLSFVVLWWHWWGKKCKEGDNCTATTVHGTGLGGHHGQNALVRCKYLAQNVLIDCPLS